jgi:medium-chain acyl-[acyl-carrier-protein] hydrolase
MKMPAAAGWLEVARPVRAPAVRLFCFPHVGAGASLYRSWSDRLPESVEVCAVQLPGRETRFVEAAFDRVEDLVRALAAALRDKLDPPFSLFGHSMGALVAFELSRALRRQGRAGPAWLFVSAAPAPQRPRRVPPRHCLPEAAFRAMLREMGGTEDEVLRNDEMMGLLGPRLRADFSICDSHDYVAEAPLDCPISAFGGIHDGEVPREDLLAWREQTRAAFTVRMLPCGHFFLPEAAGDVLAAVAQDLAMLAAEPGTPRAAPLDRARGG